MSHIAASQTRALASAWRVVAPAVFTHHRPADRVLAEFLRQHPEFGGRDRRLIGDTVHGLLRWWGWLGAFVPEIIEPESPAWARVLLAVGVLESAPSRQSVEDFWAVQAGLGEGALASLHAMPDPSARAAALLGGTAADFSHARLIPAWALDEIESPQPMPALIAWLQRRAPLWLRVQAENTAAAMAELQAAGLTPVAHSRLARAMKLDRARVNLQTVAAYREGRVEVQDISAQAVAAACGARPGERWWDACAGAGGKTLALAAAVETDGHVHATDVRADALEALRGRVQRAGFRNVTTAGAGGKDAAYDGVLVDAPCSGSGTWRRSPWARWQVELASVQRYAMQQRALLEEAAAAVRPGGVLLYATCSMLRSENRAIVEWFLAAHSEFRAEPFENPLTGEASDGQLQLWPWDADGDAMFVARMRRR